MRMRTIIVLFLLTLPIGAACGSGSAAPARTVDVVASTNVYGDIAAQIGGSRVSVTSILSDPNADPHLFEPGTRNGLAVSQARLVIQNGVGYDAFMTKLENAAPSSHRTVVTIADVLGVHGKDANPHLWYDVPKLGRIAGAIATGLEQADPAHKADYAAGLRRFTVSLRPLVAEVASIKTSFAGETVAYTEPVPGYLIDAAGLKNLAPSSFTRAIEEGTDPTPQAVAAVNALISGHKIKVLLYNSQATSPITARVRSEAAKAGIPIVGVSETLPPHLAFQQWQFAQARALFRALSR
jgi:zinc/manganese transport system substrate-binding protein